MRILVVCIVLVISAAAMVYAHCHTTADCEKVVQHLYMHYWDKPNGNTAKYYVNPAHPGKPSLTATVNAAAAKWRNVRFQNETIPFNPEYKGETTQFEAGDFDGLNVFDWVGLREPDGKKSKDLAHASIWLEEGDELDEVDIAFNYYEPIQAHDTYTMSEFCLLALAVHEMGHFAGLDDVLPEDGCSGHHVSYTMWGQQSKGSHAGESLACEDKFALHHTYLVVHPDAE